MPPLPAASDWNSQVPWSCDCTVTRGIADHLASLDLLDCGLAAFHRQLAAVGAKAVAEPSVKAAAAASVVSVLLIGLPALMART